MAGVYVITERLPDGRERPLGSSKTLARAIEIAGATRWAVTIKLKQS